MAEPADQSRTMRVLTRRPDAGDGLCLLVVNGVPCPEPRRFRGLCMRHRQFLVRVQRLEEFALPSTAGLKYVFALKADLEPVSAA